MGEPVRHAGRHRPGVKSPLLAGEIAEVTTGIGMQAGNTPYCDLILVGEMESESR